MGRHVSSKRRRSLRSRFFLALLAIAVLIGLAAFAAGQIFDGSGDHSRPRHSPAAVASTPGTAVTLALTVTGPTCQVFVRVPGGDIMVDRNLLRGESVRLDEQRLSVVLGDAGAAHVYVNGRLRPPGKAGQRVEFVAQKG